MYRASDMRLGALMSRSGGVGVGDEAASGEAELLARFNVNFGRCRLAARSNRSFSN